MILEIDASGLERALAPLAGCPRQIELAVRRALKRAGSNMAANIRKGIQAESFLKAGAIRSALGKPLISAAGGRIQVAVRVAGRQQAIDRFRIIPRRITARKGLRPRDWPSPAYQTGPKEPRVQLDRGYFAARFRKGGSLLLMKRSGRKFYRAYGYSAQYFASFDSVARDVRQKSGQFFARRLDHEVRHILENLK